MSGMFNEPPFDLGETFDGVADDATTLINTELEGKIFEFPAVDYSASTIRGSRKPVSGRNLKAVCCRNTSGAALLGKRVGKFDEAAGYGSLYKVAGYCAVLADDAICVIDPWIPSAGVADDDLFWGIIEGPCPVLVPTAGADMNGDIAAHAPLVGATGATTGNSTSGRVSNVTLAGQTAGTASFNMARNLLGKALSARTTQETTAGTEILVHVQIANRL